MNDNLLALTKLYKEYISTILRLEREHMNNGGIWRSMLGGAKPGTDSCNDRFANGVRECVDEYCKTAPNSEAAKDVIRFALSQSALQQGNSTVGVMLNAVEGYFAPLAEFLNSSDAALIIEEYFHKRSVWSLLPAQKELLRALKGRQKL